MYLSSKQLVDKFMQKHGQIKIENNIVQARRLISPAERIVLSNVCPSIPHSLLTDYLQKIGLNLLSPVTFLKISSNLPEYNHILSFRRQIYVSPHNISLPDSFLLDFDNTTYRIFLETMACYTCKKAGHIATNCPDKMESLANSNNSQPISSSSTTACYNCKKSGHIATNCPDKMESLANSNNSQPISSSSPETMPQSTATILSHEQIPIEESSANNLNNPNIEKSQEVSTMDTSIPINVDLQSKPKYAEILDRVKKGISDEQVRSTVDKIQMTITGDLLVILAKKNTDGGLGLKKTITDLLKNDARVISKGPQEELEIRDWIFWRQRRNFF
uniref:Uncharacterized protein LOC114332497 n=1 Tax=Diabrotica virgifera virgifera TaxID=50390 RepID=A0A6P7FP11_DIAVI